MDHGFYYNSDYSRFAIRTRTLCGSAREVPEVDTYGLQIEDVKFKLIKYVQLVEEMNKIPGKNSSPSCSWIGPVFHHLGYSTMNRNFVKELLKLGVNIRIPRILDYYDCYYEEIEPILRLSSTVVKKGSPTIWGQVTSAPQLLTGSSRSVHLTMSEFESNYNSTFLGSLSKDDEIWVPTEWDKNKLVNSGLQKPIFVFNLGVDSELYQPKFNKIEYSSGVNSFCFVSVMSWNWRKGHDVLFKAYFKKFSKEDDVSLILFTREAIEDKFVESLISLIKEYKDKSPHIVFCQSSIPTFAMPYIYSQAGAFVSFPRGEGWGLPLTEAAVCGVPIVSSYQGGQATFLRKEDSFLVEPDLLVPASPRMQKWSDIYEGTMFVDYSEKVIDEAAEKMRYVYDNRKEAKEIAEKCRERIVRDFGWSVSSKKMYNRILELN